MTRVRLAAYAAAIFLSASCLAFGQYMVTNPSTSPSATTNGSGASSQLTPSEREAQIKLEAAGYTHVRNVKSGPEGISAKAMKDGDEIAVVVDATGKIKAQPAR